ncbi:tryptophan dimethylallyltransferase family protein [Streptomyces sp. NRRL WC-3742]|uniref:tryptophan dimethylallyltransferase family protein n=1 Tax=Streptomyces sp. NRRL WC-3742 TaxID=1463934 RepID=UPI0004C8B685|nr:tryptophan dimethylallyltransferase family protein [Streptomyces sp. NRRL WC-3742]
MTSGRCGPFEARTLGGFTAGQLHRLCRVAGLKDRDAEGFGQVLRESLGLMAERPLDLPPPYRTSLSDDHTPVEYSLSFQADAPPTVRVLLEPGCGAAGRAENGKIGLAFVRETARRWDFSTARLDEVEDLFFPSEPQGPLALWCALELDSTGVPRIKVYLNPSARGADRAAETMRTALDRLGHRKAFASLPPGDGYPFLAMDLGAWAEPRLKVYVRHLGLSADGAGRLSRMYGGPTPETVREFFATVSGVGRERGGGTRLAGLPALSCHSFTHRDDERPTGFTLHVPVRDYVPHDGEALARGVALCRQYGIDPAPLAEALAAVTTRRLEDGAGLVAYLAIAHQRGRQPRVTAYISSEAYAVRPPASGT